MLKSFIAAGCAAPFFASAAVAAPFVNIENRTGFTGTDYDATLTELHVGYEGDIGDDARFYVQGGPALVSPDGEETEVEMSGKAGVKVGVTENISVYGEVAFLTAEDDAKVKTKAGIRYTF